MLNEMPMDEVEELRQKIAELKARFPAHSIKPAMVQELEDLEEGLEKAILLGKKLCIW